MPFAPQLTKVQTTGTGRDFAMAISLPRYAKEPWQH
jgi:hypothetical protein